MVLHRVEIIPRAHVSLKEIDNAGGELNEITTQEKKILLFTRMPVTRHDQLNVRQGEANALVDDMRLMSESRGSVMEISSSSHLLFRLIFGCPPFDVSQCILTQSGSVLILHDTHRRLVATEMNDITRTITVASSDYDVVSQFGPRSMDILPGLFGFSIERHQDRFDAIV